MAPELSMYCQRLRTLLAITVRREIVRGAIRISTVVGTILNVINQFDALRGLAPLSISHLLMNYLVPYCVATYGAARYALRTEVGNRK